MISLNLLMGLCVSAMNFTSVSEVPPATNPLPPMDRVARLGWNGVSLFALVR